MTGLRSWVGGVALAAGMLAWSGSALAQLPLSTFAGRQIGDGRPATEATLNRPSGLAFAADGALLIVDRVHDRIRRVDPATGIVSTLAGSVQGDGGNGKPADQAELNVPLSVRVDGATGDVLITETEGHEVRRVVAATGLLEKVAGTADTPGFGGDTGLATAALLNGPTDAVPDGTGGILIADRANHRVRRIDAVGNINTVAGTGTPGYTGDTIPGGATLAQLNFPHCVLPIPGGGYFICDEFNHAIRRVNAVGTITTVAGNGVLGFADGPATGAATLNKPRALAFADGTGNVLLISDAGNNRIRRLDLLAGTLTTIAGTGAGEFTADGAAAATSPIFTPSGILVDANARIVFSENFAHRVRAIDADGNLVTLVGGIEAFDGDGGPAVDAQFGQVKSVARDKDGNFLIGDSGNNRVRRVNAFTGVVDTVAGSGEPEFGGDGGPALDAGLTLSDAVVDSSGRLIISDSDNNRIRRVDAGTITTIVNETGVGGYTGDNGPALAAQIAHPTGIEIDASDNIYIADFANHAIRRVDAAGNIVTVAGTGVPGFNGDDIPATTAQLNSPTDLAVDAAGNLYIAEFDGNRIRFVSAATGLISTVAGTGVAGFSGDGGLATAARFKNPADVDVDANGNVWVADMENHRVRRFTVGGNIETVVGSALRGYAGDGGDPLQARLLFPIRLLALAPDQVLIADRDNFVVRALGEIASDCSGTAAASCVPGGGKAAADCFLEIKLQVPIAGGGVPLPRISCVDGDPSCDHDAVGGQCTFRLASCLNNTDPRIPSCVPAAITSVKLAGNQGLGAGGQTLANGLGALAPSVALPRGRGVSFTNAFTEQNGCTPFGDFVVTRKKKNGKGKLTALTTTSASGKDKDKIKLLCLAP